MAGISGFCMMIIATFLSTNCMPGIVLSTLLTLCCSIPTNTPKWQVISLISFYQWENKFNDYDSWALSVRVTNCKGKQIWLRCFLEHSTLILLLQTHLSLEIGLACHYSFLCSAQMGLGSQLILGCEFEVQWKAFNECL